jgi:putative cardiolipin synthase
MKTFSLTPTLRLAALLCAVALTVSCADVPKSLPRPLAGYALAPRDSGGFTAVEANVRERGGPGASGFMLLDRSHDGLYWRLALIDQARHTLDLQYYLWYGDAAGTLLMHRVMKVADRGVRVRIIVDDLLTFGPDVDTAKLDDHPNIEVRLFNPWHYRPFFGRGLEMLEKFERLNHRMHNKLIIADNQAVILGGRNIGDEYMGMNEAYNFHDLDILGVGPVARQASKIFDNFWNSQWVASASALRPPLSIYDLDPVLNPVERRLEAHQVKLVGIQPRNWSQEVEGLPAKLSIGTSRVLTDMPDKDIVSHHMPNALRDFMSTATHELLVVNAYIIFDAKTFDVIRKLTARGVRVRILTNSLASQDVPAVNSHYKKWRKPLIEAGVALHEIRHDAAILRTVVDISGATLEGYRNRSQASLHRIYESRPQIARYQQRDGCHHRERRPRE